MITKNPPAFTLIEILVASTIIIVLMSIGVASFRIASQTSRNSKRAADMEVLRQALVLRRGSQGNYSTNTYNYSSATGSSFYNILISTSFGGPFLSGAIPTDPSGTSYVGQIGQQTFCLCAELEGTSTKGNANYTGSGITLTCNNVTFVSTNNGSHYCVSNP